MKIKRNNGMIVFLTFCFIPALLFAQPGGGRPVDPGKPIQSEYRVIVEPDSVNLGIGEVQAFRAYLEEKSSGAQKDTAFAWSLAGRELGTLSEEGVFTALERGTTHVVATVGRVSGRALVRINGDPPRKNPGKTGMTIEIEPDAVVLAVGDTITFSAVCTDSNGSVIDTTFSWSVDGEFAAVTEEGFLEAFEAGRGFVYASIGELSGKAHILVRDKPDSSDNEPARKGGRNLYKLVIDPPDTTVLIGAAFQFEAFLEDSNGNRTEKDVTWVQRGQGVGELSETGFFTAESRGVALIQARVENYSAVARVMVLSEQDLVEKEPVQIRLRDRDGIQVGNIHRIAESDILKISGLPFPLSILNGGELILPPGSLSEGITIEISLPDLAVIRGDSVSFTEAVLNGFSFDVYVDGEKVSPYVFETPVQIVLPYKPELMDKLGLTLEDLAVFFYNEDGTFEEEGIFNIVVDTTENKVYAEIAHFSQVILGDRSLLLPTSVSRDGAAQPDRYMLYANYPNPFNPETEIRFNIAGSSDQRVKLTVYDLLGRRIRMLTDADYTPGRHAVRWDGRDGSGNRVASGVYLYRLESGSVRLTRRMVLLQ